MDARPGQVQETPVIERFVLDLEAAIVALEGQGHRLEAVADKLFGSEPVPTDPEPNGPGSPEPQARVSQVNLRLGALTRALNRLTNAVDRIQRLA
jgi:hypothetical protein